LKNTLTALVSKHILTTETSPDQEWISQPMKASAKMSGEERRAAIIRAVRRVFAEKGTAGSTTRELARAAGVSEALLFKHFPNKEALYAAMIHGCMQEKKQEFFQRLLALEPSTATLVVHVHLMVSHFVGGQRPDGQRPDSEDDEIPIRLLQRSMMEDGNLARLLHQRLGAPLIQKMEQCIKASVATGDAVAGPAVPRLEAWFAQHLAMMTMFHLLPATPIIDYGVSRAALVEQMVWFALRGMGLKDEAIRRHYTAKNLTSIAQHWSSKNGAATSGAATNGTANGGTAKPTSRLLYSGGSGGKNGTTHNGTAHNGAVKKRGRRVASQPAP
jgi:AcrR family transcriptional regulator